MPRFDPAELAGRVLHRDQDVIIIDKPAGIAVHKGPGGGDHLEAHLHLLRFGTAQDPGLGHRLDKDTSGCLALGRNGPALARLGTLFRKGLTDKTYWAVVVGQLQQDEGVIDAPLARRSHDRRSWWMKVDPAGDPSFTDWKVIGRADGLVWLELKPRTGRTHQLRVHCASIGVPIAGDHVYGGDRAMGAARFMQLHARHLVLPYGRSEPLVAEAPVPEHMRLLLGACGWSDRG
jgi:tRNA pseudouridine32 synthase / 23S rRNA pseudouridine746 synthase